MHESKEKMRTIKIKAPRKGEHMTIYTQTNTHANPEDPHPRRLILFLSPQARPKDHRIAIKRTFFPPAFFRHLSHWTRHTRPQTHWHSTHKHTGRDVTSQNNQKKNTHFR